MRYYLDVETRKVGNFVSEASNVVDRARRHFIEANNILSKSNTIIIFTESRGLMYDTGAAVAGYILVGKYTESPALKPFGEVIE